MKETKKETLSPRGNAEKGQNVTLQKHSSIGAGQCQGARPLALGKIRPEHNPRYACTDIGNGNLFADWAKALARYVPERKLWYTFNGKVWEPDTGNLRVMELCKKLADELVIYAVRLPEGLERDKYRKSVERWQVRRNREIILKDAAGVYPIKLNEFDNNSWLFNCQNGTLDLRTRAFKQHDPADLLATISGVEYDPDARSALWEQTISDVTQGDMNLSAYLQKAFGYGLTGDTSEECFFLLYGPTTRNGKDTVMETYMKLLGGYGKAARPETIALRQHTNSSGPTEDIAKLAGARAVNISEPDKQMVLSAALVKTLTGNDTMTARFLNENSFEFKPQFKLFINTNHLPKANDVTIFSSGRVKVLPFNRHFEPEEQDKTLKKRLEQELPGILSWCLDGLWLMNETGFEPPEAVLQATSQYQHDSDKLTRFVEEQLTLMTDGEVRAEEVYQEYRDWCQRNGQYADAYPAFKQGMTAYAEIKEKRPRGAGKAVNPTVMLCGVQLKMENC